MSATDRRFGVLPRSRSDIALGPPSAGGNGSGSAGSGGSGPGLGNAGAASDSNGVVVTPDTDLATLFEHIGSSVHVGGLITELTADGFLTVHGRVIYQMTGFTLE